MIGLALGSCFAVGVALLIFGGRSGVSTARAWRLPDLGLRGLVDTAGVGWSPAAVVLACVLAGLAAASVAAALSGLPILVLVSGCAGAWAPIAWLRSRTSQRARDRERAWPDALRQLADALEAGLAFAAAAQLVGESGPRPLRHDWRAFTARLRASGIAAAIDGLGERGERTADTVALLLRAGLVELPTGGLAPALRELAGVLSERYEARERARTRTANLQTEAAVLALSPIVLLMIVGLSSAAYLDAYRTAEGTAVASVAGVGIFACWLAMRRIGRVAEPRSSRGRR